LMPPLFSPFSLSLSLFFSPPPIPPPLPLPPIHLDLPRVEDHLFHGGRKSHRASLVRKSRADRVFRPEKGSVKEAGCPRKLRLRAFCPHLVALAVCPRSCPSLRRPTQVTVGAPPTPRTCPSDPAAVGSARASALPSRLRRRSKPAAVSPMLPCRFRCAPAVAALPYLRHCPAAAVGQSPPSHLRCCVAASAALLSLVPSSPRPHRSDPAAARHAHSPVPPFLRLRRSEPAAVPPALRRRLRCVSAVTAATAPLSVGTRRHTSGAVPPLPLHRRTARAIPQRHRRCASVDRRPPPHLRHCAAASAASPPSPPLRAAVGRSPPQHLRHCTAAHSPVGARRRTSSTAAQLGDSYLISRGFLLRSPLASFCRSRTNRVV
jgi:hypothetical protein